MASEAWFATEGHQNFVIATSVAAALRESAKNPRLPLTAARETFLPHWKSIRRERTVVEAQIHSSRPWTALQKAESAPRYRLWDRQEADEAAKMAVYEACRHFHDLGLEETFYQIELKWRLLDAAAEHPVPPDVASAFRTLWEIGEYAAAYNMVLSYRLVHRLSDDHAI